MKGKPRVYPLILVCLLLAGPPVHAQQPDEKIKKVFADWEKRREAIQRIRYIIVGENVIPMGSLTDDYGKPYSPPNPPKDIPCPQYTMFLLDVARNRFRFEMVEQSWFVDKQVLIPRVFNFVFDGQTYATEALREANISSFAPRQPSDPDVAINRNYSRYHPLERINICGLAPLLFAHGFATRLGYSAEFNKRLDPADFTVHGLHVYNGRQCLVMRNFPERGGTQAIFDEYWIDTGRDSAVVRQISYVNDKPVVDNEVVYQQTSQNGWLPLRWTATVRQENQIISVTRLRVQEFTIDPPVDDATFQPEIKPGMIVNETIFEAPESIVNQPAGYRPPTKSYRVGPDGAWNQVVNGVEVKSRAWLWYTLGGFAVVATAALAFWYARYRRRTIRPPARPAP